MTSPTPISMKITIETTIETPVDRVWSAWTTPESITQWNFASDDWQCPRAEIDLKPGGGFRSRMEAKDGSMGFDFEGRFTSVDWHRRIEYVLGDERAVEVEFLPAGESTRVVERFEAESDFSVERQRQGWQAILNNFKKYVEAADQKS